MDIDVMRTAMLNCELFSGLKQNDLGGLMMSARPRSFLHGETIYSKGDKAAGVFALIASGNVEAVAENGFVVTEMNPGEVIGEVGIISQQGKRTVTVKAVGPTDLLEWNIQGIQENSPQFVKKLKELAWKRLKNWCE
jgi:CRP-like cAMP-binding protein